MSVAGVKIEPERTKSINDFVSPTDVTGIARFLGMINYYHKFIPNLADIAAPLNRLRKRGKTLCWGPEQQEAFLKLKSAISQPPILRMADFS